MELTDYDAIYTLWSNTPGVGITEADSYEGISSFLQHNPGLSFVCEERGSIVGTAMCGSDSRRGYMYHLAVLPEHRGRGIGSALVQNCLHGLANMGIIDRCHAFVFAGNVVGNDFWMKGWRKRNDIFVYSKDL